MTGRRPISGWSRVLGISAILAALAGAAVPAVTAVAVYRGMPAAGFFSPSAVLLAAAAAGTGVVLAVAGAVVGRRATSAAVIVGGVLALGVLAGIAIVLVLPTAPQS